MSRACGPGPAAHPCRGSAVSCPRPALGARSTAKHATCELPRDAKGFTVPARIRRDLVRTDVSRRRLIAALALVAGSHRGKAPQVMEPAAAPARQRLKASLRTGRWRDEDPDRVHGGCCTCAGSGRVLGRGVWRRDSRRSGRCCGLAITPPWCCQPRLRDHVGQFRSTVPERVASPCPSYETGPYRAA